MADKDTDEFLKTYIAEAQAKLAKTPVQPDTHQTSDLSLLYKDREAPKNRKRFYTKDQAEAIAQEECAECEYTWRKCSVNPPSLYDQFIGCRKLRREYYGCMEKVKEKLKNECGNDM